jgi:hypothetical protein
MSTYQPPGGQQPPAGPPAYTPPQDPWAGGFEQGVASVPTDPIPQQQYGQFGPNDAAAWGNQQTVPHGGQFEYAPPAQQRRSRAGLLTVIFLAIVVLGGGGGYATYYVVKNRSTITGGGPSSPTTTVPAAPTTPAWDPATVKVGDCLINKGTPTNLDMHVAPCSTANTYKVLRVVTGASIPEGPRDVFDDTTSLAECANTNSNNWYGYQDDHDDNKDIFLCLLKSGS